MQLENRGEFLLIQEMKERFSHDLPKGVEGIGDDCAVIPDSDGSSLLVTTDLLIEDVHFLRRDIHPRDLGYKSLAVSLSDIAAMGGRPQFAFLSMALPSNLDARWLEAFFSGFQQLALAEKVYLLGGDTNKSEESIVINVAVIGKIETAFLKRRSHAKSGDFICVTDFLGDAGAGLQIILKNLPRNEDALNLIGRHYRPRPQIREGQWLSKHASVHAMMDVSDGIDSDLKRIMQSSNCGAKIIVENIPISRTLKRWSMNDGIDSTMIALTGGEDYCLLLTVEPSAYKTMAQNFQSEFGGRLYNIGHVTDEKQGLIYQKDGNPFILNDHGYDHFKNRGSK